MRVTVAAFLIPLLIAPLQVEAQSASASARTRELAALFSKNKHVVKERHGVRREKYKDVRSEPVVRSNAASYSGKYDGDFGFKLDLIVQPDGRVEGSGREPLGGSANIARTFMLRNARVDGALLTGTIVYTDGSRERLEGVFLDRTSHESPTDPGYTVFGLGVITQPKQVQGNTIEKLFYQRVPR